MAGDDVRILEETMNTADVSGLADHTLENLPICNVVAVVTTTTGPIIGFFNQYACYVKGRTVHSAPQMAAFGLHVDDRSRKAGGTQRILTPDGYVIPLHIRDGLAYMDIYPPSDEEMAKYPHVFFTADTVWDPHVLDNGFLHDEFVDSPMPDDFAYLDPRINAYGERIGIVDDDNFEAHVDACLLEVRINKMIRCWL
jgi:hypothetical protein